MLAAAAAVSLPVYPAILVSSLCHALSLSLSLFLSAGALYPAVISS